MALDTGMRQRERLAMRFGDIDWKRHLIVLRAATTKSRKSRVIPISTTRLRAVLEWLRLDAAGDEKPGDALVFSDETANHSPLQKRPELGSVFSAAFVCLRTLCRRDVTRNVTRFERLGDPLSKAHVEALVQAHGVARDESLN